VTATSPRAPCASPSAPSLGRYISWLAFLDVLCAAFWNAGRPVALGGGRHSFYLRLVLIRRPAPHASLPRRARADALTLIGCGVH